MSNVRIKITNTDKIRDLLYDHVKFFALPKISKVVRDAMRERIKPIIEEGLRDNEVWKGIAGFYSGDEDRDIAAIMGLQAGSELSIAEWIIDTIIDSIVVERAREGDNTLSISYDAKKIEGKLLQDDRSFYSSNEYIIPWLKWLLMGQGSVNNAFITFDLTNVDELVSRSGRAFMIKAPGRNWSLRDHSFKKTPNFIIQVLSDRKVTQKINKAVFQEFNDAVNKYNRNSL